VAARSQARARPARVLTLNLTGGVAATRQNIGQADGPVVLVGHSYGGAAFAPDEGESVASLIKACQHGYPDVLHRSEQCGPGAPIGSAAGIAQTPSGPSPDAYPHRKREGQE
jgi:pimeloyl-ACP methyl ester carboxylesterase